MSNNKRAPKELAKYAVVIGDKANYEVKYFSLQKDAKAWAASKSGKKQLFRLDYDYYGEL